MVISRTPLRISFSGGGTDLPSLYKKHTGYVVSVSINKYIFITVNKKFDNKIRVSYSKTEIVDSSDEIRHELVRCCLQKVGIKRGIEITSIADIPSEGTGLGSSSSYIVGLLNALYAYKGKFVTAERLAKEACEIEINILKKPIGKQDQYIAAYGGFKFFQFFKDGRVSVNPIICSLQVKNYIQHNLIMFYTGKTRKADSILTKQTEAVRTNKHVQDNLRKMADLAQKMKSDIEEHKAKAFGRLIHENWLLKKELADGISNKTIDEWYNLAIEKGANGGKILGAGGGGFMVFFAEKKKRKQLISHLSKAGLQLFPFKFDSEGSKIIYYHH